MSSTSELLLPLSCVPLLPPKMAPYSLMGYLHIGSFSVKKLTDKSMNVLTHPPPLLPMPTTIECISFSCREAWRYLLFLPPHTDSCWPTPHIWLNEPQIVKFKGHVTVSKRQRRGVPLEELWVKGIFLAYECTSVGVSVFKSKPTKLGLKAGVSGSTIFRKSHASGLTRLHREQPPLYSGELPFDSSSGFSRGSEALPERRTTGCSVNGTPCTTRCTCTTVHRGPGKEAHINREKSGHSWLP